MLEWIELNKSWFLSGAGIFIITSAIAIGSSLLTLYVKIRSDRKKRKIITLHATLNKYKIENSFQEEGLAVSYKGATYANLCQYLIVIENTGPVAVEGQELLLNLPSDSKKIDFTLERSSQTINFEHEELCEDSKREELYTFKRLEPSDKITISYILDTDSTGDIEIQPRGVDGVRYNYNGYENIPELKNLIAYIAAFLLVGTIPLVGGMLQILVLLAASNTIISVVEEFHDKRGKESSIVLNRVSVDNESAINITHQ